MKTPNPIDAPICPCGCGCRPLIGAPACRAVMDQIPTEWLREFHSIQTDPRDKLAIAHDIAKFAERIKSQRVNKPPTQ